MNTPKRLALFLFAILFLGAKAVTADTLSIIILPSGTDYYEWNLTGGGSSGWVKQIGTQNGWDSMSTTPGNTGNATVGNTQYFSLAANSGLAFTFGGHTYSVLQTGSGYWRQISNTNTSVEAALIGTTGTPSSSSSVQNLLIEDGAGGIFTYKAPNTGTGTITNLNPSGENAYGYVSSWNPGTTGNPLNTPITQLGTFGAGTESGLSGALESNGGFIGDGSGTNISASAEQFGVTNPDPALSPTFNGFIFSGSGQPGSIREGIDGNFAGAPGGYIQPTVYFEQVIPEPATLSLLAVVGSGLLLRRRRIAI